MSKIKLSVGIITYNEEKIIAKTIESVKDIADEVVILDSNSSDKTVEISIENGAIVYSENWKGFGKQKNSLLKKCSGEWIFLLDADEIPSNDLKMKIKEIVSGSSLYNVYSIKRLNIMFGQVIDYGAYGNDYVVRLWKNGKAYLKELQVHEYAVTNEKVGIIKNVIKHFSYSNYSHFLHKMDSYSTLWAKEKYEFGEKITITKVVSRPISGFLRDYIVKRGFLDGLEGFIIASGTYNYNLSKYYKLYRLINSKK